MNTGRVRGCGRWELRRPTQCLAILQKTLDCWAALGMTFEKAPTKGIGKERNHHIIAAQMSRPDRQHSLWVRADP